MSAANIQYICFPTCNRDSQLNRCLTSYVSHFQHYGRSYEMVIADDSKNVKEREARRAWLRDFSARCSASISYAGHEEKCNFIKRLVALGIDPGISQLALTNALDIPSSPGSNRNSLLLHTLGAMFLSCDDDSVCRLGDLRNGDQSICVSPFGNLQLGAQFLPTGRDAVESVPMADRDLIAIHEELLGHSLCDLTPVADRKYADYAMLFGGKTLSDILQDEGRVQISLSGVMGDSGMPILIGFMLAQGSVRESFLNFWQSNPDRLEPFNVIRGVLRPVISPGAYVMTTTATGFDNRLGLPPFIPSGRGEDTLFGLMTMSCIPDAYTGFVPLALLHAPDRTREFEPLRAMLRLSDIIMMILELCPKRNSSSLDNNLKAIGKHFIEWGTASHKDFEESVLRIVRRRIAFTIEYCQRQLRLYDEEPIFWAEEMRRWIARLEDQLRNPVAAIATDLPSIPGDSDRNIRLQRFILNFGELLVAWPDVKSATLELQSTGYRLAQSLSPSRLSVD